MTTYFVSRHPGAIAWATEQGITSEATIELNNLDINQIQAGDIVIGTLPVQLVAQLNDKGASYQHLVIDTPPEWRGMELTNEQMRQCHARIEKYSVKLESKRYFSDENAIPEGINTIQFCIASDQLEPNFMAASQLKPSKVYILSTDEPKFKNKAATLQRALQQIGIDSELIDTLPKDGNPATLRRFANALIEAIREISPHFHLMFNATGGKKTMSFVLNQTFEATANASVIYVDIEAKKLQFLAPWQWTFIPIRPDLITVKTALTLRNYQIEKIKSHDKRWTDKAISRAKLLNWMVDNLQYINYFLGDLNKIAADALKSKNFNGLTLKLPKTNTLFYKPIEQALNLFQENKLITLNEDKTKLSFTNAESRDFLNGFWIEEYCWLVLKDIPDIECLGGVEIKHLHINVNNEIDFALSINNYLIMIECKTKNFSNENKKNSEVYRVDSLKVELAGYYSLAMIVSSRDVDINNTKLFTKNRAHQNHILVLDEKAVKLLPQIIELIKTEQSYDVLSNAIATLKSGKTTQKNDA